MADSLSKKIQKVYSQAAREVKQKTDAFWDVHKVKAAQMLKQVEEGKITESDYKSWLKGQVFTGERWQEKLKDITQVYVNADTKAREIVGGTTKNVFVEFANRTARDMEKDLRGAVSFDLYDKNTVERLLKDNPKMLPEWKINEKKDYIWNEKRVQNAVTQGIIQGESVYDIGKRLTGELAASNAKKMDMFARTAVTGAQNAGRIERMHEAEEMGIEVRKKWLSARDDRVRDAHEYLDGQEKPVDEPFEVEVDGKMLEIDYPGDPSAPPELVYNCRCTLIYVYPKYQQLQNVQRRDQETSKAIDDMTYKEWKEKKQGEAQEARPEYKREQLPVMPDESGDLEWLFEQVAQEEEQQTQEPEPDASLQLPGRYNTSETDYPTDLKLTSYDQQRLEAIEHYFDDDYKMPKNMPRIRDDERQIAAGHDEYYNAEILAAQREQLNNRIKTAFEEIEQKKAAGYRGKTRQESYSDWKRLQRELRGADETEVGAILGEAQVGESGIQYWQRDKKAAERELQVLDFIEKLHRRYMYAKR